MAPAVDTDDTYLFRLPLGNGVISFIDLDDFVSCVHWALSNQGQSNGMDIGVATTHMIGLETASALTAATGKPTKYFDLPIGTWLADTWTKLPKGPDTKVGFLSVKDDKALLQTYGENFTNWWNLYKASAGDKGLIRRDY